LNYTKSYFNDVDLLTNMVGRTTATGFELKNNVDVSVLTNNFRAVRGRPVLCAIFDELAFWRREFGDARRRDLQGDQAGPASIPGSTIGISLAISEIRTALHKIQEAFRPGWRRSRHQGTNQALNPTISQAIVDEAWPMIR
jgi:hypothetical protein